MRNQSPGEQIWANSRLFIAVRTSPDGGVGGVWRRSLGWLWRGGKELSCEGGRTGRCVFVRYHGGSGASAPVGVRRQRRANAVCGRPHFAVCSPHADQGVVGEGRSRPPVPPGWATPGPPCARLGSRRGNVCLSIRLRQGFSGVPVGKGSTMLRRNFLTTALGLPMAGIFAPLQKLTAADLGKVRIADIKMRPAGAHTQIRIDTDAGISGYGESGVTLSMMKGWMEVYKPMLTGQDPLAIGYHWHRMSTLMHTYMARIPALSGIDMALWDLAGRLVNLPVYRLLGGPFREQVPVFINSEPRNMLDPGAVKDWADQFNANPLGFKATKINTHS